MKEKTPKFPLSKLVEVEWSDACGYAKWDDLKEYETLAPMPCKTAGYLIGKNKERITILQTQSIDGGATGGLSIPMPWIKSIRTLK